MEHPISNFFIYFLKKPEVGLVTEKAMRAHTGLCCLPV